MASYQVAVASGDARAYGRTLSILQQWPDSQEQPAMFHILLAAVLQHNHEFEQALEQLQPLLESGAGDRGMLTQALTIQSQIGLVIGDYELVAHSCQALRQAARYPVYLNCQAQLDGVTGNAEAALNALNSTLDRGTDLNAQDYQELMTTAAVILHRTGELAPAESYYQAALRLSPQNTYLQVNYSNLLLESGRHGDVVTLLSTTTDERRNTELNIILARALLASDSTADRQRAAEIIATLEAAFQLAFLRDEAIPHKEYAQFALYLADRPDAALDAAKANWQQQKEPSDTRLLANAAAATSDPETLAEIDLWLDTHGTQDRQLQAIITSARESSP